MSAIQGSRTSFLQDLTSSIQDLKKSVEKIKEAETTDTTQAVKTAEEVYQLTKQYKDKILSCKKGVVDLLQQSDIHFPIVSNLMDMLSSEQLQFCDSLKSALSKTASMYIQLIVFQCAAQSRRAYKETVDQLSKHVDIILSTLPDHEIETQFDLKCSKAAIQNLEPGRGKWKEVADDHALPLVKAALTSIFSLDPTGLVDPIVDLAVRIYHELAIGSSWYQKVWPISWGKSIHTIKDFSKLQEYISQQKGKRRLYIPLNRIMREILEDKKASLEFKSHILFNEALSVCILANKYPTRFQKVKWAWSDKLWKARYVSITTLKVVLHSDLPYRDQVKQKVIERMLKETNEHVSKYLQDTFKSFSKERLLPIKKETVNKAIMANEKQYSESQETVEKGTKKIIELDQNLAKTSGEKKALQKRLDAGFPQSWKAQKEKESINKSLNEEKEKESTLEAEKKELSSLIKEKQFEIKELEIQKQNLQFLQNLLSQEAKSVSN